MVTTVTARLGRAPGAVTLHQEQFGFRGVLLGTILQLTRKEVHIRRGLAAGQLARFSSSFASQRGLDNLADDLLGLVGVFLEPLAQLFVHKPFDSGAHLGAYQLVLSLGGELGVRHLDRQHTGQAFARVIAGKADLFLLRDPAGLGIAVDRPGQCATEASKVGTAIALRDVVGERQNRFVVAVIPPHRDLDPDAVFLAGHEDRVGHDRGLRAVEIFHKFPHPTFIEQLCPQRFHRAFVFKDDPDTGIQEGKFAQAMLQRGEAVFKVRECIGRGHKPDLGPFAAIRIANDL